VILVALYVLYQTINWQNWLNLNGLLIVVLNLLVFGGWLFYAKAIQQIDRTLFSDED
jgi:hypothetical protein